MREGLMPTKLTELILSEVGDQQLRGWSESAMQQSSSNGSAVYKLLRVCRFNSAEIFSEYYGTSRCLITQWSCFQPRGKSRAVTDHEVIN